MDKSNSRKIISILFIVCSLILAAVYFSVPSRTEFNSNQLGWWTDMWHVITGDASAERK